MCASVTSTAITCGFGASHAGVFNESLMRPVYRRGMWCAASSRVDAEGDRGTAGYGAEVDCFTTKSPARSPGATIQPLFSARCQPGPCRWSADAPTTATAATDMALSSNAPCCTDSTP